MTTRNGKRPREGDVGPTAGLASESHVDKRLKSDTSNAEDDRRQQREAEVSRVRRYSRALCSPSLSVKALTAAVLTTELGSPSTSSAC